MIYAISPGVFRLWLWRVLHFKTRRDAALQAGSITRTFAAAAAALLLLAGLARAATAWVDAPAFVDLFAPASSRDAYRAAVSADGLDAVLTALAGDAALVRSPGAWTPQRVAASDAFGRSGPYDRWKLARLYGGRQAHVARGARMEAGRVTESWTLVSPYPSPDLTRLEPGTLLIVLRIAS